MNLFWLIAVVVVYLAINVWLGIIANRQTKNTADFMLGGRQVHPVIMALSYGSTFISTSAIVGFGGMASLYGMSLLWLTVFNVGVGIFVAFIVFGKRTRKMGLNLDAHTFPELLGRRLDSKFIQVTAGLFIFITMPLYIAAVLIGGARIMEGLIHIPFEWSIALFTVVVALYVIMGGIKGVMYTDALQGALMVGGMIVLLFFIYFQLGGVGTAHRKLTDLNTAIAKTAQVQVMIGTNKTSAAALLSKDWAALTNPAADGPKFGAAASDAALAEAGVLALLSNAPGDTNLAIFASKITRAKSALLASSVAPADTNLKAAALKSLKASTAVLDQTKKLQGMGFQGWTDTPKPWSPLWWIIFSSLVLGVGIGALSQPQLVVRFMTVKSNMEINRAVIIGGIFILITVATPFIVGALSNVYFMQLPGIQNLAIIAAGGNADKVIPLFIDKAMPTWFAYVFMLVILAAAMSTLSGQFHTMGTALARDIYSQFADPKKNKLGDVLVAKIGIVVAIVITIFLGLNLGENVIARATAIFFGMMASSFLAPFFCAIYWKKFTAKGAIAGIVSGFATSAFLYLFMHTAEAKAFGLCKMLTGKDTLVTGILTFVDPMVFALPISIVLTILVTLFTKVKNQDTVNKSFDGI